MAKQINFTDVNPIPKKDAAIIRNKIFNIIKKKDFILSSAVKIFENNFSSLSKIKYSVGCASGTDALHLALMSLNLKKDDEVIVPAMTYISTALAVLRNNNNLVFADIENDTGLISIDKIAKKISRRTRAVIPVNLYGQKFDLKKLRQKIGKKIYIIEDSAQSHFAYSCFNCGKNLNAICCKKERNDPYADISCYSFYPAKNIGAYGDGGLVSTTSNKFYKRLISLRNLGFVRKYEHKLLGINSRLDAIQAVVLNRKLKTILKFNQVRRKIAKIYDDNLRGVKEIKLTRTTPGSTRHLYVIRLKNRGSFIKFLKSKKISCQIHYPYSLNKLKSLGKRNKYEESLENSEKWANECVSLPMHPKLHIKHVYRVVDEIKRYYKYR